MSEWRVGRTLGRTLYRDDVCVGMVDTSAIAAEIVALMNGFEVDLIRSVDLIREADVEEQKKARAIVDEWSFRGGEYRHAAGWIVKPIDPRLRVMGGWMVVSPSGMRHTEWKCAIDAMQWVEARAKQQRTM